MQAAQVLAGYTLGGADLLRRAMGKKKPQEMAKQREIFVKGCAKVNNIPAPKANQIFDLLEKFAGYGFNKSHAAAYAIVAYQTAYLKANYPVEFLCAMMTNDMADTAKLAQYINEAREFGIEVLQPDINESQVYFAPARDWQGHPFRPRRHQRRGRSRGRNHFKGAERGRKIQIALRFVRAGGRPHGEPENSGGAHQIRRVRLFRPDARVVACANRTHPGPRREHRFRPATRAKLPLRRARRESARSMPESISNLPEWPQHELLAHEKELLGFYVTGHPLTPLCADSRKIRPDKHGEACRAPNRSLTRIGGMIAAVQNGVSKKSGKPYSIITLEDLEGSVQVLCINENYEKYRDLLKPGKAILVIGEVNTGDERPKIFPQEIMSLEDAPKKFTKQVHLRLQRRT